MSALLDSTTILSFYDTETTDLPQKKLPITHPKQPHIVQLATVLTDLKGNEVAMFNQIIRPEGYDEIAQGAFEAHGITFEKAMDEGKPRKQVLDEWRHFIRKAVMMAAHNNYFDKKLLEFAMLRTYGDLKQSYRYKKHVCTMNTYKPIVKMPPTERMKQYGFNSYKPPSLQETYVHCFGKEFEGAHDGLSDTRAVAAVFFALPEETRTRLILGGSRDSS